MKCCINGGNVIRLLSLSAKLLKFEIQKCGQILCAHKPYFLMPGHIYNESNKTLIAQKYLVTTKLSPCTILFNLKIVCHLDKHAIL